MDIVFVASEMTPFSKTGGLADVAEALPRALARRGHRVRAVSPHYRHVPEAELLDERVHIRLFGMVHEVRLHRIDDEGVEFLLVDHPSFHRSGIYGDRSGPYGDNLFRYALLSRVALEIGLGWSKTPLFHVNDWHTALLPVFLDAKYRSQGLLQRAGVVLGLHNLGHQGSTEADEYWGLDISDAFFPLCEMDGRLNPLKAGIVASDALIAVSPSYARQIQQDHGFGLESVLQMRSEWLVGVLNGIDERWNPATDPHLDANYSVNDLAGKALCKSGLQRDMGLPERADVPMLGMISRLDHQKGVDLLQEITPWLMERDIQLMMLGSGSPEFEHFFREVERRWPSKARGWVGFNEPLAHRIEAASDIFLMPSRFEPCGLNQMYSMRYGTVPVVHATGGLADTVITVDPAHEHGNGWAFQPFTSAAFAKAIEYALHTYWDFKPAWQAIQRRGMTTDFSWDRSAALYEKVYERVLAKRAW